MKKSIIATGAASLALAAMPVVGVFAATSSVTDEIEVTIAKECAITSSTTDASEGIGDGTATNNKYAITMQNGEVKTLDGSNASGQGSKTDQNVINVVCNDSATTGTATSWKLSAVGGDGTTASTVLDAAGSGTDIATSTTFSGATSAWGMQVTGNGVTIQNGFDSADFHVVPGTPTTVSQGNGSAAAAFTMKYRVYISETQAADTYTGHVTYTLANPDA